MKTILVPAFVALALVAGAVSLERRGGFRRMRYDGLKKVLRGLTTIEEIESFPGDWN